MAGEKEPFVSPADRPTVNLNPDAPITELRVRDLHALIQSGTQFKISEFGKHWKLEVDKIQFKIELDKMAVDVTKLSEGPKFKDAEGGRTGNVGDPFQAIDQVIRTISGLSQQVAQLSQEVQQLKQRSGNIEH